VEPSLTTTASSFFFKTFFKYSVLLKEVTTISARTACSSFRYDDTALSLQNTCWKLFRESCRPGPTFEMLIPIAEWNINRFWGRTTWIRAIPEQGKVKLSLCLTKHHKSQIKFGRNTSLYYCRRRQGFHVLTEPRHLNGRHYEKGN
jgi:hypothetical protein